MRLYVTVSLAAIVLGALGLVSGASAKAPAAGNKIDVSSKAAAARYLRSVHVDPTGLVVQRGTRNYAGPRCPGTGWTCTSTNHPVVQVATASGRNVFRCSTRRCSVVQAAPSTLATNTAKCVRTTGISQSCSISQTSATANNRAIVVEIATKTSGLTQNASQTAHITQQATGGASVANGNTACVLQKLLLNTSTVSSKGSPVTAVLDGHQSISVSQDSAYGDNLVESATTSASCTSDPLTQTQTIAQTATGTASVTQHENAAAAGPNASIDIEQNQSTPTASGSNTSAYEQTSTLTATAYTPTGPVSQTQSSPGGGLLATVHQFSTGLSTSSVKQSESQTEHAQKSSTDTSLPPNTTQVQYGPVHCCSNQADNPDDTFSVDQSSTQTNDTHQNQTNVVTADCSTSGTCTATETTSVDGTSTTNTQTGSNVSISLNCTDTTCTPTPITFDGSPGTGSPGPTLGPYTMTPFGLDSRPLGEFVSDVPDPAGTIGFAPALRHDRVGEANCSEVSCWLTWSHGYTGDVYDTTQAADPTQATITLPAGTNAFYFYAEPNQFAALTIQATAQDGTTSGPISVQGDSSAQYFGFYGTGGATLASITVTTSDTLGFAVGEFGIAIAS